MTFQPTVPPTFLSWRRPTAIAVVLLALGAGCSSSGGGDGAATGGATGASNGGGGGKSSGGASGSPSGGSGGSAGGGSGGATTAGSGGASGSGGDTATGTGGSAPAGSGGSAADAGGTGGAGGGAPGDAAPGGDVPVGTGPMVLTSTVVKEGAIIDPKYRCKTENVSPPLSWTPGPAGTLSYAITLLHAASVHWVLWDIPANVTSLPEGITRDAEPAIPPGSKQMKPALDGATWFGYTGPCPQGAITHYEYTIYALKVATLPGVTTASMGPAVNAAVIKEKLASAQLSVMAAK